MAETRKPRKILIWLFIFILGFSLRLIYLSQVLPSPLFDPTSSSLDDALYYQQAQSIAQGNWLGQGPFSGMPLYPYFLAGLYKLFAGNLLMIKMAQLLLGALSCLLIYSIAEKIFGFTAALISAVIACGYGPFIFYEEVLVAEALTIFLYLLSFRSLLWALKQPSAKRFLGFGLLTGLAGLTKASILLFIPVLAIYLLLKYRPIKRYLFYLCSIGLGVVLLIAAVTWRNYLVCRDFIPLAAHGGINFYIGNNNDADGTLRTPKILSGTREDILVNSKIVAQQLSHRELKPSQVCRFWFAQGRRFIRQNPGKFISLLGRKLLLLLNFYEIPDVRDYQFGRQQFGLLNFLFGFNLVLSLAVLGITLSQQANRQAVLLKLFIAVYVVSILLFFVNSRYRLPLVPFLIILAASGSYQFVQLVKAKLYLKLWIAILTVILVIAVGNLPLVPQDFSGSHNIIGLHYLQQAAYPEAISQFKQAAESPAHRDIALYNMGRAYLQAGQLDLAQQSFDQALGINPYLYAAHNDKGNIYLARQQLDQAAGEFTQALRLNPGYARARANLGLVYKHKGEYELALEQYQKALKLDSTLAADIYNNMGLVYLGQGRVAEAIAYFQKSLALKPDSAQASYNLDLAQKQLLNLKK